MALARRQPTGQASLEWAQLASEEFVFAFSSLLEFLCRADWEEGVSRVPGTAMVLVEDGLWKLWLHDKDARESLWLTGPSLESILASAESHLRAGTGDWRRDRQHGNSNGKRRS